MIYQIWKAMEEDEKDNFVSARHVLESLPFVAGVSLQMVQKVMASIRKKKDNQLLPQPPRCLSFDVTPQNLVLLRTAINGQEIFLLIFYPKISPYYYSYRERLAIIPDHQILLNF